MKGKRWLVIVVSLLALGVAIGYSLLRYQRAQRIAQQSAEELAACQKLVSKIRDMSLAPERALKTERNEADLRSRIDQAAGAAGIPTDSVFRVIPHASTRLGDSAYLGQPTRLELRDVSLRSMTFFLQEMLASESALHVTTLRLTPPQRRETDDSTEVWDAEIVLTHVVFSPKSDTRSSS